MAAEVKRFRPKGAQEQGFTKASKRKVPERVGGSYAYYFVLIAVTLLVSISILMVISAQSGEFVISQVKKQAAEISSQGEVVGLADINTSLAAITVKHVVSILLGIALCFIVSRINYQVFARYSIPLSLITLFLLVLVPIFGEKTLGATRWLVIAGQSIQPSEFVKPALIVLTASAFYYARPFGERAMFQRDILLWPTVISVLSIGLIVYQPDMGTTLIIVAGIIATYLVSEMPFRNIAYAFASIGALGAAAMIFIPNRRERMLDYVGSIFGFRDPPYQALQAKLAFGSGGIFGSGPGLSRQKYRYVPESQNDFILAIIGEELGLFGALLVVGSFITLAWAGFKIAISAKDPLGRAIAGGSISMLLMQAVLNIYSVIGLGPVTGKPLPFVTQGGSAMIGAFLLLGLILSVSRYGNQKPMPRASAVHVARYDRENEDNSTSRSRDRRGSKEKTSRLREISQNREKQRERRARIQARQEEEDDEDSLEWRWDSGSHLPRSGPRK